MNGLKPLLTKSHGQERSIKNEIQVAGRIDDLSAQGPLYYLLINKGQWHENNEFTNIDEQFISEAGGFRYNRYME